MHGRDTLLERKNIGRRTKRDEEELGRSFRGGDTPARPRSGANSSVPCWVLEELSIADSPLFIRDLRRDIFAQLVEPAGGEVVFGDRVTTLRELIHFTDFSFREASALPGSSCSPTGGAGPAQLSRLFNLVVELRQWPMAALENLNKAHLTDATLGNCSVVLNLTSARVPGPTLSGNVHVTSYMGLVVVATDNELSARVGHSGTTPYALSPVRSSSGEDSHALCTDGQTPFGAYIPSGRRLVFVSRLEQCMAAHSAECRQAPELSVARFYQQSFGPHEYAWFPGGDGGAIFGRRANFSNEKSDLRSRYFSHDVFASGANGGLAYELFEIDDVRANVTEGNAVHNFRAFTNPTGDFESQFFALRNVSCSALPGTRILDEDTPVNPHTMRGSDVRERLCKLACFRAEECRSVDIGPTWCAFWGGTVLDSGRFAESVDLGAVSMSSCFVKDTTAAVHDEAGGAALRPGPLRASGVLENCLFASAEEPSDGTGKHQRQDS